MEKITIGKATIEYDIYGIVERASFEPTLNVNIGPDIISQLARINNESQVELQSNADLILGAFFSKLTEIEVADREMFAVKSRVVECVKYTAGAVKKCVLEYTFEEREEILN